MNMCAIRRLGVVNSYILLCYNTVNIVMIQWSLFYIYVVSPVVNNSLHCTLTIQSLGAGISGRNPSTTSCDSQTSGSLVSPNSLEESSIKFRELETKLQRSEEMSLKRLEEKQHSDQEHEKALAELEKNHAAALEEKVKELEKTKSEFETILSAKKQELLQEKTEEFRALRQQQQQEWQTELEKRESEFETTLSVREQELVHKKNEEFRALQQQQQRQQQEWQKELEKRKNEYESRLSVREREMTQ